MRRTPPEPFDHADLLSRLDSAYEPSRLPAAVGGGVSSHLRAARRASRLRVAGSIVIIAAAVAVVLLAVWLIPALAGAHRDDPPPTIVDEEPAAAGPVSLAPDRAGRG